MEETDLVFYGTPIEREEDPTSRKKKADAEASGQLRTLPSWKQEVRDEEGRRRFHGAFTGGYSAGYYNTVGSKEGWAPQSFTSSRKSRAEVKQQDIMNFLDEDEKADLEGRSLGTSSQFDTFGFTAAEVARKQADKEQDKRPSAIPGPVPDELVLPASESIGVKLLLKMGWRHGRSIKDSSADSLYDARRKARKAFLAFSSSGDCKHHIDHNEEDQNDHQDDQHPVNDDNLSSKKTPLYSLEPKQDSYGLGYDPYKHAPEFREQKRARVSGNRAPGNSKALTIRDKLFASKCKIHHPVRKAAPGFGIGALEEYDVEDEDVYNSTAYEFESTVVQELEDSSKATIADPKHRLTWKEKGVLPGFKVASVSDYQMERFNAPEVPKDFVPRHKFAGPLKAEDKTALPPPPEVPPPEDSNQKVLIDGVATLVARCGKLFEDLSREKNQSNPSFGFLMGGKGHDYYERKLWEEQQKHTDHKKLPLDDKSSLSTPKMNAENRGKILGERPLERSSGSLAAQEVNLQSNLSDTFTKPLVFSELPEVVKPFKDDPAKQDRFQQFLKQKYQGGLRSADSGGSSYMSEAVRAQERLDFELAADALEKANRGHENKFSAQMSMDFFTNAGMQFTSAGVEHVNNTRDKDLAMKGMYPKREEYQWRPAPVLCKRFDLVDPYMGKLPPPPRTRGKIDSLVFKSEVIPVPMIQDKPGGNQNRSSSDQTMRDGPAEEDPDVEVEVENVERPVDLYKAIFSDDSDEEAEASKPSKVEDPAKKTEVANATLNRLMAGDFLESLGKELGLEVPRDLPYSHNKPKPSVPEKEAVIASIADDRSNQKNEPLYGNHRGTANFAPIDQSPPRTTEEDKIHISPATSHRKRRESTSSEDELDRRSSRHRRRYDDTSSESLSESSDEDRDRHRSKSKRRRKESSSSKDKKSSSRSRKHSRHRHHRSSKSSSSRHHHSGERKDRDGEGKREKRKRRD
ncbi:G patch domain-containing protein TGH [Linum grandiflorum]